MGLKGPSPALVPDSVLMATISFSAAMNSTLLLTTVAHNLKVHPSSPEVPLSFWNLDHTTQIL